MRRSWIVGLGALVLVGACTAGGGDPADLAADLARGGRLYDSWYAETRSAPPEARHPSYPADGPVAAKPAATWRCKECHGWDYLGRDGAYATGSHATGIPGIAGAAGRPVPEIAAVLRDATHGFAGRIPDADLARLARFVSLGQVDMDAVIDRSTHVARGDAARGAGYYATLCAGCHGADGRAPDMPVLGKVGRENPWETLHKILNGQPDSTMPALRALDRAVAVDVLAHVQTLPAE